MSVFYVYEHWRLYRDECFYVGKGKGDRAYRMRGRNLHHRAIMDKLSREGSGMEVRMVATGLSENEAFSLEIERISFWRELGIDLANHTNGGDGISGLKMSLEAKAKMSAAKKGKPGNVTMLGRKHSDETKAKMSAAHKGVKKSPDHAAKVGLRHKGKIASLETRAKLSAAKTGISPSEETRNKLSLSNKGQKRSEDTIINMKAAWVIRKAKRQKMEDCNGVWYRYRTSLL